MPAIVTHTIDNYKLPYSAKLRNEYACMTDLLPFQERYLPKIGAVPAAELHVLFGVPQRSVTPLVKKNGGGEAVKAGHGSISIKRAARFYGEPVSYDSNGHAVFNSERMGKPVVIFSRGTVCFSKEAILRMALRMPDNDIAIEIRRSIYEQPELVAYVKELRRVIHELYVCVNVRGSTNTGHIFSAGVTAFDFDPTDRLGESALVNRIYGKDELESFIHHIFCGKPSVYLTGLYKKSLPVIDSVQNKDLREKLYGWREDGRTLKDKYFDEIVKSRIQKQAEREQLEAERKYARSQRAYKTEFWKHSGRWKNR